MKVKLPNWVDCIFVWPVMVYRLLKYGYTYRRIYLGEGKWVILDQQDYCRLSGFKWYVNGNGVNFYAFRNMVVGPGLTRMKSMHRDIMNAPKGILVDHRNHDTLDNRSSNLRLATHSQNTCNRRKKKNGSSQFLGVYFNKEKSTWDSQIMHNGKKIWVGRFQTQIDAARAYDEAARKYHGEFARLNFPLEDYNAEIRNTND